MKKEEKENRVADLWAEYRQLQRERKEREKEAADLKAEEKAIEGELAALVPDDDTLGGVFHRVYEKPSVQYSKAFDEVVSKLVPRTKAGQAEAIKEEFTTVRRQHSFKEV